ncbi:hypothetical protein [Caulobacter endophyticus]|uniref:Uncharacterized protein n=1 Tax=Caulobacter endophyticus TaxID=2172652 RepID=A0A2T9KCX1_9CAUL|nr:hypothetical protein [Caulobacter endophyticus]PVM93817.1 hypothetical protein DDF67_02590 [Caulobacter endophyticus]
MVVSVSSRILRQPADLSKRSQSVLSLVPRGLEWLSWAIGDASARFAFADETELLAQAAFGLHGARLVLLPGLQLLVSPVKLTTLRTDDLEAVIAAERSPEGPALVEAQRVLARYGLLTQADLARGAELLAKLGVAEAPVFQLMDYPARAAVRGLVDLLSDVDAGLAREAAAFAVEASGAAIEFPDYVETYLALALQGETASARTGRAKAVVQALATRLFGHLEAPKLSDLAAPSVVNEAIRDWRARGKFLGFSRLSSGVREVVAWNGAFDVAAADEAVRGCVDAVSALLDKVHFQHGVMLQDGAVSFPLENREWTIEVRHNLDGLITLDRVRRAA